MPLTPIVAPAPASEQSPLDGAALLDAFAAIGADYRALAASTAQAHCPTSRRRILARRRAVYRAALTLVMATGESEAEAAR